MMRKSIKIKTFTIAILSLLAFAFLLGFSFSVQAYRISRQELNSPVSQYLRENYGVDSIEEYRAKLEQEVWLNISKQMEDLASEYPEINFSQWLNPDVYRQYGTSTYQPPKMTPQQPFYIAIFSEPVTALQIFSLSGLGLMGLAAVPPVRKNKRLKQALVLGIVVLATFSVGYFVGLTTAQTGTITIEPASFSGDYSYLIETDGTYVWAKSGKTGEVVYGGQWNAGGVSGTDASTVIQSAINALTNGGKIFIKAGIYRLKSKLSLNSNNELFGEGINKTVLLKDDTSIDAVYAEGKQKITITNLTVDGAVTSPTRTSGAGIYLNGCSDVFLFNVESKNNDKEGFLLDYNCTNVIISHVKSFNNWTGIVIRGSSFVKVVDSVIDTTQGTGIYVNNRSSTPSTDIQIISNTILNTTDSAIDITTTDPNPTQSNMSIIGNLIKDYINGAGDKTGRGITLGSSSANIVVEGNIILNRKSGILAYGSYHTVRGNLILNYVGGGSDNPSRATGLSIGDKVIAEGNVIMTATSLLASVTRVDGIDIGQGDNHIVSGNIVINQAPSNLEGYGIAFATGASRIRVVNNVLLNWNTAGIDDFAYWVGKGLFAGNQIEDNRATKVMAYGIRQRNTGGVAWTIVNNQVTGAQTAAISLAGTGNIVKNNIGYDTESFKVTGVSVTVGTGGAYGSATAVTTPSGRVTYPRIKITWGGTFGTGETVTVKVEAAYSDGTTAYVEKSATATGSLWLTDDDVLSLITQGKDIVKLNVYAKTNLSSTTVTVTVDAYGKA
jgi:hypothetical protein